MSRIIKRRKTSGMWKYFDCLDNYMAECTICKQKLSYRSTISNLKTHLHKKHLMPHSSEAAKTLQLPITYEPTVPVATVNSSEVQVKHENKVENTLIKSEQLVHKKRRNIVSFIPEKMTAEHRKKIDKQLMNLFIKGFQPFSILEGEGFRSFVEILNPAYKLPPRKLLSSTLLSAMYEECYEEIQIKIKNEPTNVCLTTDCWTSSINEIYMAVTVHYINDNFDFNSVLLECTPITESGTDLNLANHLKRITDEWCLSDNIVMALSDNSTNIRNAMEDHLEWNHFGCYAHTLNLIVQDALKAETLVRILKKIRRIVSYFKQSNEATEHLIKYQLLLGIANPKRLKQDVQTMWNSTYFMLLRIVELQEAVQNSSALLNEDIPILSLEEWLICVELCKVLKPFEEATTEMCGKNYMMASLIVFLTNGLVFVCNKFLERNYHKNVKFCVENLKEGLKQRLPINEIDLTLATCTFLDPRFKQHAFSDEQAPVAVEIKDSLIKLITEMIDRDQREIPDIKPTQSQIQSIPQHSECSIWTEFDKSVSEAELLGSSLSRATLEVQRYMEDISASRHENPLEWWKRYRPLYPYLAEIFKTKCGIVGTSVPCARLYTKAGNVLNDHRTRLSTTNVTKLIFLNANLKQDK